MLPSRIILEYLHKSRIIPATKGCCFQMYNLFRIKQKAYPLERFVCSREICKELFQAVFAKLSGKHLWIQQGVPIFALISPHQNVYVPIWKNVYFALIHQRMFGDPHYDVVTWAALNSNWIEPLKIHFQCKYHSCHSLLNFSTIHKHIFTWVKLNKAYLIWCRIEGIQK